MRPFSRILVAIAALSLFLTFFLPVWFIYLMAPQYPEGLTMQIWLNHLSGQVEIINGLNHYIGMKHINESMFPEFGYLRTIMAVFAVLGLLVAATGRRKLLFAYLMLLFAAAGAALYDFYQWGYDYGHHLDPKAAIQVPGLFYQPPLIGHKTLLNFDAFSYPDSGGWVVIGAGLLCVAVWIYERFGRARTSSTLAASMRKMPAVAATVFLLASLASCSHKPEPFVAGRDACADCRMTVMDLHFGAELLTAKGRVLKFDDLHCLRHYLAANPGAVNGGTIYYSDFTQPGKLLVAAESWGVTDAAFKSPMNSNTAFFPSRAAATAAANGATVTEGQQLALK